MKKLYMIIDVHPKDSRYHIKERIVGTVVRIEPDEIRNSYEPGWVGNFESYQYSSMWYGLDIEDCEICDSYHYAIKIKPLQ